MPTSTLENAWNVLVECLPEIVVVTKLNTFKGYVRILKVINGKLFELTRENKKLVQKLGKKKRMLKSS